LVAAMVSMHDFARAERKKWEKRGVPMTVDALEGELERRQIRNGGA